MVRDEQDGIDQMIDSRDWLAIWSNRPRFSQEKREHANTKEKTGKNAERVPLRDNNPECGITGGQGLGLLCENRREAHPYRPGLRSWLHAAQASASSQAGDPG